MRKWFYLLITIMIVSSIFWFSSKDAETSSGQTDDLIIKLKIMTEEEIKAEPEKAKEIRFLIRKAAHFSIYLLLGAFVFLTVYYFLNQRDISFLIGLFITIILSISDEFHQSFVPGRSMELRDVLIDSSGALIGILFVFILVKSKQKKDPYSNVYHYGR